MPKGGVMAVNDVGLGYVRLLNGHRYSIAVFIENSAYNMPQTEALVAKISEMEWKTVR